MSAGRAELAETFLGHLAGIFTDTVVSENNDELFITGATDNTPGNGNNSHKKISNNDTDIRVEHWTQMHKDAAFSKALGIQCDLEILQKIESEVRLFDFTGQMGVCITEKILKCTHIFDQCLSFKTVGICFDGLK